MIRASSNKKSSPQITKQTAGGVTGAVIGGIVAGPVGAIAGGVAGAMVGNSSAQGNQPLKKAVNTIRAAGVQGGKALAAAKGRLTNSTKSKKKVTKAKPAALKLTSSKTAKKKTVKKAKPGGTKAAVKSKKRASK